MKPVRYALVTPVLDEADNLPVLAESILAQTVLPVAWLIIDTGSTDGTCELARRLASEHTWIRTLMLRPAPHDRGAPIVQAIHAGIASIDEEPDVVVKLDADVSVDSDYFERLVGAFGNEPRLGLASGSAYELERGEWVQRMMASGTVWGASRAYRWTCLPDVLPLEERMGWDGIDQIKANLAGWETRILLDLPFRHHRREGEREGSRLNAWCRDGSASYFMGYRFSYLVFRALHHARREPAAVALIWGYCRAALNGDLRCADPRVRRRLRDQQRLRNVPPRVRDAIVHR